MNWSYYPSHNQELTELMAEKKHHCYYLQGEDFQRKGKREI